MQLLLKMTTLSKKTPSLALLLLVLLLCGSCADAKIFGVPKSLTSTTYQGRSFAAKPPSHSAVEIAVTLPRGGEVDAYPIDPGQYPALFYGMAILTAASLPYIVSVVLWLIPHRPVLFGPPMVYRTDTVEEARKAYKAAAYWKCLYATLGFGLTLFQMLMVYCAKETSAETVLKKSFFLWFVFYAIAIKKIRIEKHMLTDPRLFIQSAHIFFALSMLGAATEFPPFIKFMAWLTTLFGGEIVHK